MSDDVASLIIRARSVLGRVERQRARFLDGRPVTTRRACYGGNTSRHSGLNRRSGTRKKDASGTRESTSTCGQHHKSGRPRWLCVPQSSRRSLVANNERSHRSLSVPARRFAAAVVRAPTTRPPLDESDVESILLRDRVSEDVPKPNEYPEEWVDDGPWPPQTPTPVRVPTPSSVFTCSSEKESSMSVNTFVAHQVRDIMENAAMNVVTIKAREEDRGDEASRVRCVRHQILRTATYTAVCRRLEHALHLYGEALPFKAPVRRPSYASAVMRFDSDHARIRRVQTYRSTRVSDLPKNTLLAIFSLLSQEDLVLRVAPVCRQWRYLAHHRSLWRHFLLDWSSQSERGLPRVPATCALLASIPGLWTLELVGCADVDRLLWQVANSCRRLRTLAVDSCIVSESMKSSSNVSADVSQTRLFFESASWHAPGARSRSAVGGARTVILHNIRTNQFHREDGAGAGATNRSALFQWRRHRDHATVTYYGINVRVNLSETYTGAQATVRSPSCSYVSAET